MLPKEVLNLVTSVVLAGGQGSRLFPLTQSRCKPSVSFGGNYRLIDIPLSNSLNSQINRMYVISQFFASELQEHIFDTYKLDMLHQGRIEMLCPEETPEGMKLFKGTADAVRQNMRYLLTTPTEYFLILSGDQLYNIDFRKILLFAMEKKAGLVIAALDVKEAEAKRMGLLKIDKNSYVTDFNEKPQEAHILKEYRHPTKPTHFLGSMGIYVFNKATLISILQEEGDDFGKHLIPQQVKKGDTYAFLYDGYWEDIGTINAFYNANLALLDRKEGECLNTYDETNPIFTRPRFLPSPLIRGTLVQDSYIGQGSIVEAKEISRCILGLKINVQKGAIIKNSIVLGNSTIGENTLIEKAIVDENAQIGKNVQLINKSNLQNHDGDGIYVRDGIIVVTTDKKVPDNFVY